MRVRMCNTSIAGIFLMWCYDVDFLIATSFSMDAIKKIETGWDSTTNLP
jgi:hypothetical protein